MQDRRSRRERSKRGSHLRRLPAADRRQQLMLAATRLFAERGFAGTTTWEIANAAGVTEALIFKHFSRKEDLYKAILEEKAREAGTEQWVTQLQTAESSGDDRQVLRRLMTLIMDHSRRDPEFLRLMLHAALDHRTLMREFRDQHLAPLFYDLVRFIRAGQQDGRFRAGDPHVLARVLLAVPSYDSMLESLLGGDALGPVGAEAAEAYTDMLLDALTTPRAGRETKRVSSAKKRSNS
jgi:TetR/AcrR family transcriptional regulator